MSKNWKEVKEIHKKMFKHLDTLDLMPYMTECEGKDLHVLKEKLDDVFPYKDEDSETLFDWISVDEFADYLNERYGLNIREETVSYFNLRLDTRR